MRRRSVHEATSISATSFALLHATQTVRPSIEGCAQVGEQPTLPDLRENRRATAMLSASISTSSSFIMQTEYWRRPSGERREPCGITQVGIRRTSTMSSVYTTETDDGSMAP